MQSRIQIILNQKLDSKTYFHWALWKTEFKTFWTNSFDSKKRILIELWAKHSPENSKSKKFYIRKKCKSQKVQKEVQKLGERCWGSFEVVYEWPKVSSKKCHSNWFIEELKFTGLLYPSVCHKKKNCSKFVTFWFAKIRFVL